jgi:glycosyltransferase involved in cell wall biosynthesis
MIKYLKYLFNLATGFDPRIIPLLFRNYKKEIKKNNKIAIYFGNHSDKYFKTKIYGGKIKLFHLKSVLRETPSANILYLVSSALPSGWLWALLFFKFNGRKFVLNQNGVYHSGFLPYLYPLANLSNRLLYINADYIIYQSQFCKKMAINYLDKKRKSSCIMLNPATNNQGKHSKTKKMFVISLMGNQQNKERVKIALEAISKIKAHNIKFVFNIYGHLNWTENKKRNICELKKDIENQNLTECVKYKGYYSRKKISKILNETSVLLHTQSFDASPTTVSEAIAAMIPVVYIKNGGTPEIVGKAGIGVNYRSSTYKNPGYFPEKLAHALIQIKKNYKKYQKLAIQQRAKLSVTTWQQKHIKIFKKLNDT